VQFGTIWNTTPAGCCQERSNSDYLRTTAPSVGWHGGCFPEAEEKELSMDPLRTLHRVFPVVALLAAVACSDDDGDDGSSGTGGTKATGGSAGSSGKGGASSSGGS